MIRSKDLAFGAIDNIAEEFMSSGSSDYNSNFVGDDCLNLSGIPQYHETVQELYSAIAEHKLNMQPAKDSKTKYGIKDMEYDLNLYFGGSTIESDYPLDPISLVISQYVYVDKFLDGIHQKSQVILGWTNVKNAAPSDYQTVIQNYIKSSFATIRSRMKQMFILAPTADKLGSLANTRVEQMCNRILYQYNGFGFPEITDDYMWCSDKRMMEFTKYSLSDLFASLKPPTAWIFDCNNAEVVIDTFRKTADFKAEQSTDEVDWSDWICLCAMSQGETLPADPIIPKDIFTNFLLTPVRAIILVIVKKYFRSTFIIEDFPVEMPLRNLWDITYPEAKVLKEFLVAIVDSIACDGIENSLYVRLFRKEISIATLFRNFLIAQHYMSTSRIHPKCHPTLPDLSCHPLWSQFDHLLVSAISNGEKQIKVLIDEFFDRLIKTVNVYMDNGLFDQIKPYQLSLLYHMLMRDEKDTRPAEALARYAASKKASQKALINTAFFPVLFARIVKADIHSQNFHNLVSLVLSLLFYNPKFQGETQRDDITILTSVIFDKTVKQETRTIVTAIVAFLVITYDRFLRICNEQEFLVRLTEELKTCPASQAFWLLMLAKRTFDLYSPSPTAIISIGLHVQVAAFLTHEDPMLRNAALGVLFAFMQPFESAENGQLLFLCLHLITDTSVFTRFYLLQMIKKYILGLVEVPLDIINDHCDIQKTYTNIIENIYNKDVLKERNMETILKCIDEKICQDDFVLDSFKLCYNIVLIMSNDPHPEVSALSRLITSYLETRASADILENAENIDLNDSEEISFSPPDVITFGDDIEGEMIQLGTKQNEALFFTALRNLINGETSDNEEENAQYSFITANTTPGFVFNQESSYNLFKDFDDAENMSITCATFANDINVIAGTNHGVICSREGEKASMLHMNYSITTIKNALIHEGNGCFFTTNDGCIFAWKRVNHSPLLSFRPYPSVKGDKYTLFARGNDTDMLYTFTSNMAFCCWNIEEERLISEHLMDEKSFAVSLIAVKDYFVVGFENGVVKEIRIKDGELEVIASKVLEEKSSIIQLEVGCDDARFALTKSGRIFTWNDLNEVKEVVLEKQKYSSFAVHRTNPVIVLSPEEGVPFAIDMNGNVLATFQDVSQSSYCISHETLPYVGFVSTTGDVTLFKMSSE